MRPTRAVMAARAALVLARRETLALRFVLLIGVLSFFPDFTYEGGAQHRGDRYPALLRASGAVVGICYRLR